MGVYVEIENDPIDRLVAALLTLAATEVGKNEAMATYKLVLEEVKRQRVAATKEGRT